MQSKAKTWIMLVFCLLGLAFLSIAEAGDYSGIFCLPYPIRFGQYEPSRKRVFAKGEFIEYSCGNNYELHGNATARCIGLNKWDTKFPYCKRTSRCKKPDIPFGAYIYPDKNLYYERGAEIEFTCYPGYYVEGEATLKCTPYGKWSYDPPTCIKQFCEPPRVRYLITEPYKKSYNKNERVYFQCSEGYGIIGKDYAICLKGGEWSNHPSCETKCKPPHLPENGYYYPPQAFYLPGQEVHYYCSPGFTIEGIPIRKCNKYGDWDPFEAPKCRAPFCKPPVSRHGKQNNFYYSPQQSYYKDGEFVTLKCLPPYWLVGSNILRCSASGRASGRWLGYGRCVVPTCPKPLDPKYGYFGPKRPYYKEDEAIWFKCYGSYQLKGKADLHCRKGGVWDHPPPICQAPQCPHPPSDNLHASYEPHRNVYTIGVEIRFKCDPYFALKGHAVLSCKQGGRWSHPYPTCEVGCFTPKSPIVGYITPKQTAYYIGQQVWYKCPPGYRTNVDGDIVCQSDKKWSRDDVQCVTEQSCRGNCFQPFSGGSCSCDESCFKRQNCCSDFLDACFHDSYFRG